MANLHIVEAEVLGDIPNGFRLKVSVLDLGLYMYGWTTRASTKSKSGWWVQPPATRTANGWKHTVEFDKAEALWVEIEVACINAVLTDPKLDVVAEATAKDLTSEGAKENLDKAVAKFGLDGESKAISWLKDDD